MRTSGARFADPDDRPSNPQRWLVKVPVVVIYTYVVHAEDREEAERVAGASWLDGRAPKDVETPYIDLDIIESEEL